MILYKVWHAYIMPASLLGRSRWRRHDHPLLRARRGEPARLACPTARSPCKAPSAPRCTPRHPIVKRKYNKLSPHPQTQVGRQADGTGPGGWGWRGLFRNASAAWGARISSVPQGRKDAAASSRSTKDLRILLQLCDVDRKFPASDK